MKTMLLTAVAAIALSLGAASASNAATPVKFSGVTIGKYNPNPNAPCFYRFYYAFSASGYVYRYYYICD